MEMPEFLESEEELRAFLAGFEAASLPKGTWTHAAHVAMAAVYLRRYGADVLTPTRTAIQRFNAAMGGPSTAYHETLTVLWLAMVDEALVEMDAASDLQAARHAVTLFGGDSKGHTAYYSYDVVKADAARTAWVAPDLRAVAVRFGL